MSLSARGPTITIFPPSRDISQRPNEIFSPRPNGEEKKEQQQQRARRANSSRQKESFHDIYIYTQSHTYTQRGRDRRRAKNVRIPEEEWPTRAKQSTSRVVALLFFTGGTSGSSLSLFPSRLSRASEHLHLGIRDCKIPSARGGRGRKRGMRTLSRWHFLFRLARPLFPSHTRPIVLQRS